ncbi:hypothetical protein ABPG74_022349 [Tetrahymena malaccensis]
MNIIAQLFTLFFLSSLFLQTSLSNASKQKTSDEIKRQINHNLRDLKIKTKPKTSNRLLKSIYDDDKCEDTDCYLLTMNSDQTEQYYFYLDKYFPYNNFAVTQIQSQSSQWAQVPCDQQTQAFCFVYPNYQEPEKQIQKLIFTPSSPIIIDQEINITNTNNQIMDSKSDKDVNDGCPAEGITIIASKAPEDQPVHIFLSSDNQVYIIIFDDTQHPVQKQSIFKENLNSYISKNEKLTCFDIEVYDSDDQSSNEQKFQDSPDDSQDCYLYVDCNIQDSTKPNEQIFAMIFIPLKKDPNNDIINSVGTINVNRYELKNQQVSDYFYNCNQRISNTYSNTLVMYCPNPKELNTNSNLLFLKSLEKGADFPNEADIVYIKLDPFQNPQCQNVSSFQIKSMVTNPLYNKNEKGFSNYWQFAMLVSKQENNACSCSSICKCVLSDDNTTIICSFIQLSDSCYHEMTYIQEDTITLFVGSDSCIDEIQVGDTKDEDGQNLIVGSLSIGEANLVLTKVTVNSQYIMAQMRDTSFLNKQIGNVDVVIKIFSRSNDNSFMHFYQKLESPVNLFQNDNFYDMGNYIMVYLPNTCILQVTRVTQKPLIISTQSLQDQQNLPQLSLIYFSVEGTYLAMNAQQIFETKSLQNLLIIQLVPYNLQVLDPEQTLLLDSNWEQQTVSLPIKSGVAGSLLYFIYEPSVQNDKFQSLIDFNQTISVTSNFFDSKTIFYLQINDSNKLYNPPNFRVVIASYSTPCVIESYYCPINNKDKKYFTGNSCIQNFFKDLSVEGQQCNLDTYSEGKESSFVADKTQRLGYVCEIITNKQEQSYVCNKIEGDFVQNEELLDISGQIQGYSQVDFFSYISEQSVLVTVTMDRKKLILYLLTPKRDDLGNVIAYCSEIFLVVDKYKLSSLDVGKIIQVDSNFLIEDFIFLLTSDLKIYTLTRIQQLYLQKQSGCPDENQIKKEIKSQKKKENSDDQLPSLDRLVHVSYVIDLQNQVSQIQGAGCSSSKYQQIFSLFGFDDNTISLIVLCYGNSVQVMQEYVFQNPFYCTWNRQFPFFNYVVDPEAPHFTDGKIIYIYTSYKLRIGEMKAYLLFNIYDFTPNSVIFQVVTYYPQQYPDQSSFCNSQKDTNKQKKLGKNKIAFTYFQFQKFYQDNPNPSLYAAPFTNNVKKSITMCLFSFEGQTIITYLNYVPTLFANAYLTTNDQINLNMIISKINLYDIHFNQYSLTFDFTDSQIQINTEEIQNNIVVQNTKQQQNIYQQGSQFPLDSISGPIESYQVQLFKNGKLTIANDQLTSQNSVFGDYLSLQKYYYSFTETYFKYNDVQDIINFSSYQFSDSAMNLQDSNCQDCQNLIAVLSSQYIILIEKNQYNSGQQLSVSRIIKEFNLLDLDQRIGLDNAAYCRMTLNSNSQILIYCVSKKKSTTFKLYQVQYNKNDPFSATVVLRQISSTGGYIGYVDYIIPFEYNNIVYLAIQTHYIQNQKTSIFKIATIICAQVNHNKNDENGCSLQVTQTFPTDNFQLTGAYIVDYDAQLIINQNTQQQQVDQQICGLFLSESELNIIFFEYVDKTFQAQYNIVFDSTQIKSVLNLTKSQTDNINLIFIKLINIVSLNNFTFLMGTNINIYEIQYINKQYVLTYTYGKYYQCEYISGYKPVIFNLNGAPLNYKTNFNINTQTTENPQFQIKSIISSCSRQPTQNRPVFDPEPSIFSKQTESMFYIQYFVKNRTSKSWPVRILTLPQQTISTSYIFEGFTNNLGESRVLVSNYSYFLSEFQVHASLTLNLSLAQDQADQLSITLVNGFTRKQLNITIEYDDTQSESKNEIWFIVLIVVISLVALIALVFIILWIKKQRNVKAEKKRERKNMMSSGLTDLTDQQSEKNYQVRQYPAQSKLVQQQNYQQNYQQEERDIRPSAIYQPSERNKSQKYNRLSMQLDNLLRSVSMMNRRNNTGEHNNSEINIENNPNNNDYTNQDEDNYLN